MIESIESGDVDSAVNLLLDGQCPNQPNNDGLQPLYAAINQKNAVMVSLLLEAKADVACHYDFGGTALHLACKQNLSSAVAHLLGARADVTASDIEGDTPLHVAAVYADAACVRLLLAASPDLNKSRNLLLETPLVSCFTSGPRSSVAAALLDYNWPEDWLTVLLMNLRTLAPMIGPSRFVLFSSCRGLRCEQEFFPLLRGGSDFTAGSPPGTWSSLPLDCRVHATAFFCSFPDITFFLQTHRDAWPLLLRATNGSQRLQTSLVPCSCHRLCLNQYLSALLEQSFPSPQDLRTSPASLPSADRPWTCFHSADGFRTLWMAERNSPRVYTVAVALSPVIQTHRRFLISFGVTTADHPAAVAWPRLFARHAPVEQRALQLIVSHWLSSSARWCTEARNMPVFRIPMMSFATAMRFTFVCSVNSLSLFDSRGQLLARTADRTLTWPSTCDRPVRGFIILQSQSVLPDPQEDVATTVEPVMTQTCEAKLVRPLLRVCAPRVLCICVPAPSLSGGCWASILAVSQLDFFLSCRRLAFQPSVFPHLRGGASPEVFFDFSSLPADCRVHAMVFLCCLPDILSFLKTHRAALPLLLQAATRNRSLSVSLRPCACRRLCLNQCLHALCAQGFPLKQQLQPAVNVFPAVHRVWESFQSADGCNIVWMAQNLSPTVSSTRISFSPAIQRHHRLQLCIGVTTENHPAPVVWPHLFQGQNSLRQSCFRLIINRAVCESGQWCTEGIVLESVRIPRLDFVRQICLTFVCGVDSVAIFGSTGELLARATYRCLAWPGTCTEPIRAFVHLRSPRILPSPEQDLATIVQPLMTTTREAKVLGQFLTVPTRGVLSIQGGVCAGFQNQLWGDAVSNARVLPTSPSQRGSPGPIAYSRALRAACSASAGFEVLLPSWTRLPQYSFASTLSSNISQLPAEIFPHSTTTQRLRSYLCFSAGGKRKASEDKTSDDISLLLANKKPEEAQASALPRSALIIKKPWCELILSGKKTWEIRGERCAKRERIALAQSSSGLLVGEVDVVDSFPVGDPATAEYLWAPRNLSKHCLSDCSTISYKNPYAWVFSNPTAYMPPKPFCHKPGCRKWVLLRNSPSASAPSSVRGGATSARGRPLWAEIRDSDTSSVSSANASLSSVHAPSNAAAQHSPNAREDEGPVLLQGSVSASSSPCCRSQQPLEQCLITPGCVQPTALRISLAHELEEASSSNASASSACGAPPEAQQPLEPCLVVGSRGVQPAAMHIALAHEFEEASSSNASASSLCSAPPEAAPFDKPGWEAFFLSLLQSRATCGSFLRALQQLLCAPPCQLSRACAELVLRAWPWFLFFATAESNAHPLPFALCALLQQHLQCVPVFLWQFPAKNVFILQSGSCWPSSLDMLQFPCVAYNDANGSFFLVKEFPRIAVPALAGCPAVRHLELVMFGIASNLLLPTENLFSCFKTTRADCVDLLVDLETAVSLRPCRCLLRVGDFICSRGLSQLCLVLSETHCVDLIILDSDSCLFHVSNFHVLQAVSWAVALHRLQASNCYLFVFNHSTRHFVQALLRIPKSDVFPERWLGQAPPTARAACVATVPLNVAHPPLTVRLSQRTLDMFLRCDESVPHPEHPLSFRGGAASSTGPVAAPQRERVRDEFTSLLRASPDGFDHAFQKIFQRSPERAQIVTRYLLADLVKFPIDTVRTEMPQVFSMTSLLAQKAGCPFEWAFLLFLPVLGTACSKARLYINEFFLVPPLLWIGLCLDSGANKSGVMTAMCDIVSGFEKVLLEDALKRAKEEHAEDGGEEEEMAQEMGGDGSKKRKTSLASVLARIRQNRPALFSDEGSLPAIGLQMSQNGHRAIGMYDEGRFLLRALSNGEGSGFNASTMSKLFNGSVWKRTVVKDHNRFSMHHTCLCLSMTFHIEEWHEFLSKDGALGMQSRFLTFHSAPRLDKAADVLDPDVYQAELVEAPLPTQSLLDKFVKVLAFTDRAHESAREYIP
eukprot:Skav222690  [mRNA]  locus=scaffold5100:7512:13418:- [translate_table: standard]